VGRPAARSRATTEVAMKIRIRKIQKEYTLCDGGIDIDWVVEIKYWYWPFWITSKVFGEDDFAAKRYYFSLYEGGFN
jgi:hypothetical protein